jgi:chemotaxis protein histidine kinase CheA
VYLNLRFVASASLVALASLVGVLALFPDALEELVVASAETSDSPATACKQDWLRFDPSCLSRRGMPWVAPFPNSNATPSTGEDASARPLTESPSAAAAPVEPVQQSEAAAPQQGTPAPVAAEQQIPTQRNEAARQETPAPAPVAEERQVPTQRSEAARQETPAPPPVAEERRVEEQRREATAPAQETSPQPPVAEERHIPKQRREVAAPRRETPPPVVEGRRAAKPAAEAQPRAAAPKKPASEDRAAKQRPVTEALNAVRRFQDNLHDIPVSAYAADGTRRTIVIRPTSIQDVYYYSAPR